MAESAADTRNLEQTPTWAVASICFGIISVSIILEHFIHLLTQWVKKLKKKSLEDAVEKLKSELMLLGFISLILAVLRGPISSICIPSKYADIMLPCSKIATNATNTVQKFSLTQHVKKTEIDPWHPHRLLATDTAAATATCADGKVPLITIEGIDQLHIFIFVLAATQLICSLLTMALGRAKMLRWKAWEKETETISYQVANDPARFRFTRETTFGRRHLGIWTKSTVLLWIRCFFRQFFHSLQEVDYLTLRHGFIKAHMPTNNHFNFRKYIQRSLEDDFKVVVGISPPLWLLVVILLLADVNGVYLFLWMAYVPLILLLVLGTKLEVILARMALQLTEQATVTIGAPVVQPDDSLFWFSKPRFVLQVLHFTMFANAFEFAFSIWATVQFGSSTCLNYNLEIVIARLVSGVVVLIISSYITLPIYALVTQMGSNYKSAVLEEELIASVKRWHDRVKNKRKEESSSHGLLKISRPNFEMGSIRTTPLETLSSLTPVQRRSPTGLIETISPPWNEISEVEQKPAGEGNDPSGSVILELSALNGHDS